MANAGRKATIPEWVITAGGGLFLVVLFISAYWEPDIRWLHFFQSWMYIAAIFLSWMRNRWGHFIGISAAAFWNYLTLFVNPFLKNGLDQAAILIRTGHLPRPDLFISVPGWGANLLLIIGCFLAYHQLSQKRWSDVLRLLSSVIGTTAFFALAIALFQPRYLVLFRRMLHPHLHL